MAEKNTQTFDELDRAFHSAGELLPDSAAMLRADIKSGRVVIPKPGPSAHIVEQIATKTATALTPKPQ